MIRLEEQLYGPNPETFAGVAESKITGLECRLEAVARRLKETEEELKRVKARA